MNPNSDDIINPNETENSDVSTRRSANWDIANAPRNYLSLVIAQGGSAFFAFASVWLITKTIGAEGYGGVVAVIAASQVAQIFVNWTSVAVVRFGVDEFIETGKIARTFWLRLFILVPNLLLVLLTAKFWFPPLSGWLKLSEGVILLVFLHFAATILWIHIQYSLQAVKMPRLQGVLLTIERFLIFSGLLILFLRGELNVFSAALIYAAIPFLMIAVGLLYLKSFVLARFAIDKIFVKKFFAFSLPLIPFTLVGYFSGGYVDAVFISKFLSTQDLGVYSIATQINGIALQLPTLANTLLMPFFITLIKENRTNKLKNYFADILPGITLLWSFFCVLLAFGGYFLIPVFFGAEFVESAPALWILLAASGFSLPVFAGYAALSNAVSATYVSMFASIFAAAANVAFNFLLIPVFGAEGCAWATVITYFMQVVTFFVLLRRKNNLPLSWTFQAMMPILASAGIFSLTRNPFYALLISLIIGVLIIFLHKGSLREAFNFLKTFKKF